ncbi:MAG: M28 family metallopeptidase, partial [Gemmataceae bacterium]
PKKDEPKKEEPKRDPAPMRPMGGTFTGLTQEIDAFLKEEGAAAVLQDSGKPHGLLVTTGGWGRSERAPEKEGVVSLFVAHEHYAMLHRLITQHKVTPKIEIDVANSFSDGPVTVYNIVGEIRGSEKPDEFVVIGAHLDSWDLASGTTDNGTGSSIVLETARTFAAFAKQGIRPKRTIRFVLFSGEEQGLHGSRQYVKRHKEEMPKHSVALVHDTGTGKVRSLGLLGRDDVRKVMENELITLKQVEFDGLSMGGLRGGTDHWSFHQAGVPGFACSQDMDEYLFTHHTQSDTLDKAKEPNLVQGAQVLAVTAMRVANLPALLPGNTSNVPAEKKDEKKEEKKDVKPEEKKETKPPLR